MLKKNFSFGTTFIILVSSMFALIILHIAGSFYPPILDHLTSLHIYELIIVAALIELLYLSLRSSEPKKAIEIYRRERDYYKTLLEHFSFKRPNSVDMMSAGLSSRYQFIVDLLELQIPIRLLIQTEDIAIDKIDAKRLKTMIDSIYRDSRENSLRYLEIRALSCVASIRAIIGNFQNPNDSIGLVGWYTYNKKGRIMGQKNPSVILDGNSPDGRILLGFARQTFKQNWKDSENKIIFPPRQNTR